MIISNKIGSRNQVERIAMQIIVLYNNSELISKIRYKKNQIKFLKNVEVAKDENYILIELLLA